MEKYLLCLFNFLVLLAQGQKETANWYFGYKAGLSFQNGGPVQAAGSDIWTQFSSSSVSDSVGNLLFYVRGGDLIYNKNHDTMANGFNFGGHYEGGQASLVIRKSGSQYYVISYNYSHLYGQAPIPPMINYALVDMSLAGGLGSVTAFVPISPTGTAMIGRMTATRHCNGKDHWLLTHKGGLSPGSNEYYAYLVTGNGINSNPVISAIGSNGIANSYGIPGFYRGMHKFSPNGKKVAAVFPYKTVELYDFDNSTGILSNVIKLDSVTNPPPGYNVLNANAKAVEFSPDGTKLYVTYTGTAATTVPYLCQFDLDAGSPSAIAASKTTINAAGTHTFHAYLNSLQLALDGKIYVGDTCQLALSVINNPNSPGASCNYVLGAVSLGTAASQSDQPKSATGLPSFITNYFEQKPTIPALSGSISCGNAGFSAPVLSAATGYSVSAWHWNFGDPLTGSSNTSTLTNPSHVFSANGNYTVQLVLHYLPCGTDTIKKVFSISGLPAITVSGKTSICKGESTSLNFTGATSYTFNGSSLSQSSVALQPTATTVYTVTGIDNSTGCQSKKTASVNVSACSDIFEVSSGKILAKCYPNPTNEFLYIDAFIPSEVAVYDISHRELIKINVKEGKNEISLDGYANGVYLIAITYGSVSQIVKFIKYGD